MATYGALLRELGDPSARRTVEDISHRWGIAPNVLRETIGAYVKRRIVEEEQPGVWRLKIPLARALDETDRMNLPWDVHIQLGITVASL
jgi:hypothetical protein